MICLGTNNLKRITCTSFGAKNIEIPLLGVLSQPARSVAAPGSGPRAGSYYRSVAKAIGRRTSIRMQNRHPAVAEHHVRPLSRDGMLVPLPQATCLKAHRRPGNTIRATTSPDQEQTKRRNASPAPIMGKGKGVQTPGRLYSNHTYLQMQCSEKEAS